MKKLIFLLALVLGSLSSSGCKDDRPRRPRWSTVPLVRQASQQTLDAFQALDTQESTCMDTVLP